MLEVGGLGVVPGVGGQQAPQVRRRRPAEDVVQLLSAAVAAAQRPARAAAFDLGLPELGVAVPARVVTVADVAGLGDGASGAGGPEQRVCAHSVQARSRRTRGRLRWRRSGRRRPSARLCRRVGVPAPRRTAGALVLLAVALACRCRRPMSVSPCLSVLVPVALKDGVALVRSHGRSGALALSAGTLAGGFALLGLNIPAARREAHSLRGTAVGGSGGQRPCHRLQRRPAERPRNVGSWHVGAAGAVSLLRALRVLRVLLWVVRV